jgi:hypothetical protein
VANIIFINVLRINSVPGLVQSLRVGSVDVTNITIQWDRVNCVDRNGEIDSYIVIFYPTSNPSDRSAQTVSGTGDSDRMLSIAGLPPRTSYTFEVDANNPLIRDRGAIATTNVSTTAPLGELSYQNSKQTNEFLTVMDALFKALLPCTLFFCTYKSFS